MTTDRNEQIEFLFHEALDRPPGERTSFLSKACGDDLSLKDEVETLLAAHEGAPDFPRQPAWARFIDEGNDSRGGGADFEIESGLPHERLGEFRLIRRIGEGGMGVVYQAIQESLNRRVALKVIRSERMGSFEAESRFKREVEAVSNLRHPNIVTVYGSGEEQGVRYFAMELVRGKGLDEIYFQAASEKENISRPELLGWIRDVADALHCAHQAGIIHRDVKPSNIRITSQGQPMLMDFGVARHRDLSTLTLTGDFRGTPHYASPEQVEAKRRSIDARTDIYSLGVTLYEGVTGQVPFLGETTEQVFHQILEREPVPPRQLVPSLSRDVDTVILTAMDKDPDRRYRSMDDFARDLQRILNGEMIWAKPAGMATRLVKRIRRNPLLSAAVGFAVLTLVVFFLYILWSYPQIRQERNRALEAKAEAEKEAHKAKAVNEFLEDMLSSADPRMKSKDMKVADVLDDAAEQIENAFENQPEVEASLRITLGRTYYSLSMFEEAEDQLLAALEIKQPESGEEDRGALKIMNDLAMVCRAQGRLTEAESIYRKVIDRMKRLAGDEDQGTLISVNNLASVLQDQGRFSEAEALHREVLEKQAGLLGEEDPDTLLSMSNLALVLASQARYTESEALYEEVLRRQRGTLGDSHPHTLKTLGGFAGIDRQQGRYREAEKKYADLLELQRTALGNDHLDTLVTMNSLASTWINQGRYAEAETLYRESLALFRQNLGIDHPSALEITSDLAMLFKELGRFDEAEELMRETYETALGRLGREHPVTTKFMNNLVAVLLKTGKLSEAEPLAEEVVELRTRVLGREDLKTLLSMTNLANLRFYQGRLPEAEALFKEIFDIRCRISGKTSAVTVAAMMNYGVVLKKQERFDEAEKLFREAMENTGGDGFSDFNTFTLLCLNYGDCLIRLGRYEEAEAQLLKSFNLLKNKAGIGHRRTRKNIRVLIRLYDTLERPEKAAEFRALLDEEQENRAR